MNCTPLRDCNSSSILGSPDVSSPNAMNVPQRNSSGRGAPRGKSSGVASKVHRGAEQQYDSRRPHNHLPRQNGNCRSRPTETRPRNDTFYRNNTPNTNPNAMPPRFQKNPAECAVVQLGFCNPPIPCHGVIDPCLAAVTPCTNEEILQIKQVLGLAKPSPATCPVIPMSMCHPVCNPNLPSQPDPPRVERYNIPQSTLAQPTASPEQLSQKAEVISPPPKSEHGDSREAKVDLSRPPGLPRPNGRGAGRNHSHIKPIHTERLSNRVVDNSRFEQHNGPVVASGVISPPPPGAVPKTKPPGSKDVPRSPSTASSSLSGDPSGSSVVFSSDTTFTSVDTNISDKVTQGPKVIRTPEICRRYMGYRHCYILPCRFFHPGRIDQPDDTPKQPTGQILTACDDAFKQPTRQTPIATDNALKQPIRQAPATSYNTAKQPIRQTPATSHNATKQPIRQTPAAPDNAPRQSAPAPQHTVKTSTHVSGPSNGFMPPKHEHPSSADAEPPPKPEPLYATTISDHIKVRFDEGFEVRDVVTGFESRWVHLGNIAGTVTSAALNKLLGPYNADVVNLPESTRKSVGTVKVQFPSPADAIKAVTDLNGIEFAGKTISAKSAINNSHRGGTVVRDTDVQLVWECPSRVGYAGYDTLKDAKAAMESINGNPCENMIVTAQLYEGLPCIGAYNVIFKQIPGSMSEQRLRKFANTKSVMMGRPNYESLDKAVKVIRSRLEEYGTLIGFDVVDPPFRYGMVKAWAHFTTPAEARAAQDDFDRRRPQAIGHTFISCRHVVSVSHVLSAAIYKKVHEDIGWLRNSWHFRYGPCVSIREKTKENAEDDSPTFIKISCDQSEMLSVLKYEFEQLLRGQIITLENKPLWDDFLVAPAGRIFVTQLQAQFPGIQIQVQSNRRVITLLGPIMMRQRVRAEIVRKISELKALQVWRIPLSGRTLPIFISAELSNLQELLGPENCVLERGDRMLVVRGNDVAFRVACSAVQSAQSRQEVEDCRSDAICPVCFGEAIVPVTLACGHRWCRACLGGYLTSAVENKLFPLRCLGNDATCTQCIPLGLSRKTLSAADFNAVLEAAFWVYVHGRPDEFYHCPTPDCAQVYRAAPRNSVLQCPSCLVRICPACRIAYHDGMTCEERDVADDKLFKAWTLSHDVKCCPGCKMPIERSEGCNHVTCTRCQTHICWECLATFPRGQGIYDHMRSQHGGIGL